MIKRIYIDNYKCFSNFELKLDNLNLLLGLNGSGKSCLLEVIRTLKALIVEGKDVDVLFPPETLTAWDTKNIQTFQIDIENFDSTQPEISGLYHYELEIEHDRQSQRRMVKCEELSFNNKSLWKAEGGKLLQFVDDPPEFSITHEIPRTDKNHTALNWILRSEGSENLLEFETVYLKKSICFCNFFNTIYCLQIDPKKVYGSVKSDLKALHPTNNFSNFLSWYMQVSEEQPERDKQYKDIIFDIFADLERIEIQGVDNKYFRLRFSANPEEKRSEYVINLEQLSDGQRALLVLYAILSFCRSSKYTIFFDEPDNFLALQEIQPWLMALKDVCEEDELQAILISHHPEAMDYLTREHGIIFDRINEGPVVIGKYEPIPNSSLSVSEVIARGWQNG